MLSMTDIADTCLLNNGPLKGIRVLDLSRILAGPTCTQLLGDLGAEIIKVERPKAGDDTRKWGPPYVKDAEGNDTSESAYYLCANRNKRSLSIDITQTEGQSLVKRLAEKCDVLVENFKVGGLAKYGLAYDDLKADFPGLIYCSITGFGQTGPYASRAGYDFMIQAMGGIMSITGPEEGAPYKVGLGIADVMCGMYASNAILAALHHRDTSTDGKGQYIDLSLLDTQVAWLINNGLNYLTSRKIPQRHGNAHPNIVPYEVFPSSDGYIALAVGNDAQFQRFCTIAGQPELAEDARFTTNSLRVEHRKELVSIIRKLTQQKPRDTWLEELATAGVPAGPVNQIDQVFDDPQIKHRQMELTMPYSLSGSGEVSLIANPIKFSETPVSYRHAPPTLGKHNREILSDWLGLSEQEIAQLKSSNII